MLVLIGDVGALLALVQSVLDADRMSLEYVLLHFTLSRYRNITPIAFQVAHFRMLGSFVGLQRIFIDGFIMAERTLPRGPHGVVLIIQMVSQIL